MLVTVIDRPAEPHCGGLQWSGPGSDALAGLAALVLVGRAQHAVRVLGGALLPPVPTPANMRAQVRNELSPPASTQTYHRDGLLFEIIGEVAPIPAVRPAAIKPLESTVSRRWLALKRGERDERDLPRR
jgi:hypothetical protein